MKKNIVIGHFIFKLRKDFYKLKLKKIYAAHPNEFMEAYRAAVKLRNTLRKELNTILVEVIVTRRNNIKVIFKKDV